VGAYTVVATSPAIHCDSHEYKRLKPLVAVLLVFPVALFPFLVMAYVYRHGKYLGAAMLGHIKLTGLALRLGPIYETYTPKHIWWESLALVRRTLLVVLSVGISDLLYRAQAFNFLMFLIFLCQIYANPFLNTKDNVLESISLGVLVVIALIQSGLLDRPEYPKATQVLVTLLVLAYILFWLILKIAGVLKIAVFPEWVRTGDTLVKTLEQTNQGNEKHVEGQGMPSLETAEDGQEPGQFPTTVEQTTAADAQLPGIEMGVIQDGEGEGEPQTERS